MKLSQLIGRREKEAPRDAQLVSHKLLVRGGYVRQVGAGLFSLLPAGMRVIRKIEGIIREEMNAVDGQEVLMPVVLPRELWDESGRYESVGQELLRFKDRNDKDMLLGMTHEEAVVHLARGDATSYKQYPFILYQIQTKYRDEARPRGGLIRVREFTMKDAYSWHTSKPCLEECYHRVFEAYERIFRRAGLRSCVSVESDAGMMGGGVSHEFMLLSDSGEDTLVLCDRCSYSANREVARTVYPAVDESPQELELVDTPDTTSIEAVAQLLKVGQESTCKAVFCVDAKGGLVLVILRGDLEVNEAKLKAAIGRPDLVMADEALIKKSGMVPGYASPMGTDPKT
ncbi:MAG: proline--tRNA ligase, partial [Planctomycetes bacterium]|nr:proline--tRNA ligase [Planctomycetota bacterium]